MEDNKLSPAIQLAKAGHKKEARQLLETILKEDPNNATAWLWMSDVAKDNQEKKTFLKRVLELDPDNKLANRGLLQLSKKTDFQKAFSDTPISPNRIYPPTQTVINEGDTVLKYHHSQSTICTVRSLDKTIKERWHIES